MSFLDWILAFWVIDKITGKPTSASGNSRGDTDGADYYENEEACYQDEHCEDEDYEEEDYGNEEYEDELCDEADFGTEDYDEYYNDI